MTETRENLDNVVRRIVIYGNAGAGKSWRARELAERYELPILALDDIAWSDDWAVERPRSETLAELAEFAESTSAWIIEGCYGDLIEAVLPHCTQLLFMNPGTETCVENCHKRGSRLPEGATDKERTDEIDQLIAWVRQYDSRTDEFGFPRHRQLFDDFDGAKREYTLLP